MSAYYLLGKKLPHSYSAKIHRDRGYDYALKEIDESALGDFIKRGEYDGLNVTLPYKETVLRYLDEIDGAAARIGAVNTIVRRDGKIVGYNTDYYGMRCALESAGVNVKNKPVVVLGGGGAGKTARVLCSDLGAKEIFTVGRTSAINYENCYDICRDARLIINCTPLGTYPFDAETPVNLSAFRKLEFAFDCAYNPFRTEFLLQAEANGLKRENGLKMLVAQGLAAEKLWTGKDFTVGEVYAIARKIQSETVNVAFIGMPGAGKTVIGRTLAAITGRELVDTDEEIKRRYKLDSAEIINRYGERYFREAESNVLDEACQRRGVIISTGGGSVLREDNRRRLKRNCAVFYIKRDLSLLSQIGRPLSEKYSAKELFDMRKPFYEETCDYAITNDVSVETAAKEIVEICEKFSL